MTPGPTASTTPAASLPSPLGNGERVQPGPVVGVDEIDPDGGVPDAGLALAGFADLDVLPAEDLGAAGLVDADGFRHGVFLEDAVVRSPPCGDQDTLLMYRRPHGRSL